MNSLKLLAVLIVLALSSYTSFACCKGKGIINYQLSQFVAKAKILKLTPDPNNKLYYDAQIKVIDLYKGAIVDHIKVEYVPSGPCEFLPQENSIWLIFASKINDQLVFCDCSESEELDSTYNETTPKYNIDFKFEILRYLRDNKISDINSNNLYADDHRLTSIRGYDNKNRLAVYLVSITPELIVSEIKTLQTFQNDALNRAIIDRLRVGLQFIPKHPVTGPTQMIIFCQYFKNETPEKSFVKLYDL